jgi:DNA-binding NarL/FixJ family response regulator
MQPSMATPAVALLDPDPVSRDITLAALRASDLEPNVLHDPREALALAREGRLDVLLTELQLPYLGGHVLLELMREQCPGVPVIFIAASATRTDVLQALRRGKAFDFFLKPLVQPQELLTSLHLALHRHEGASARRGPSGAEVPGLSPRERAVAELLAEGLSAKAIAQRLNLKEKAVRHAMSGLYQRLGVSGRTEAALRCRQLGMGAPSPANHAG